MQASATLAPPVWQVAWLTARPATLLAGAVPVAVGSALAMADGRLLPGAALAALLGAIFIQIGTNLVNDYADFARGADTAERLGPARATQRGWLTARQVLALAVVAFAAAVACGSYLLAVAGWPVVVIGVVSILAGIAYTAGPFPLGYHGLGDVFVFVFFGMVAVCGTYYVQARSVSPGAVLAAAAVGALATAILVVNNLRDRRTDEPAGKRTLAVRFGATFARRQYATLLLGAYAAPALAWVSGIGHAGWLLPYLSLPMAWSAWRGVRRDDGAALNVWLGRTARLEALFGVLLAAGVLL